MPCIARNDGDVIAFQSFCLVYRADRLRRGERPGKGAAASDFGKPSLATVELAEPHGFEILSAAIDFCIRKV
jgi:hypothetical protein